MKKKMKNIIIINCFLKLISALFDTAVIEIEETP